MRNRLHRLPIAVPDAWRLRSQAAACLLAGALVAAASALAPAASGQTTGPPPLPLGMESLSGPDTFHQYCSPCHGTAGLGDGPVARALRMRPADLTRLAAANGGRFPRAQVAAYVRGEGRSIPAHGSTDMPVWGPTFRALDTSDARVKVRIENIVAYLESIQEP